MGKVAVELDRQAQRDLRKLHPDGPRGPARDDWRAHPRVAAGQRERSRTEGTSALATTEGRRAAHLVASRRATASAGAWRGSFPAATWSERYARSATEPTVAATTERAGFEPCDGS